MLLVCLYPRRTSNCTASGDSASLPVWATGFRIKRVPMEWNISVTTLNLCHTAITFCDNLGYVLIKQYVWVSKNWCHSHSNFDLPNIYHSLLEEYVQKIAFGLLLKRTKIYHFVFWLLVHQGGQHSFLTLGQCSNCRVSRGCTLGLSDFLHSISLWLPTFNYYSLGFDSSVNWKISLTPGNTLWCRNNLLPYSLVWRLLMSLLSACSSRSSESLLQTYLR